MKSVFSKTVGSDFKKRRFLAQEPTVSALRTGGFRRKKRRFLKQTENQIITSAYFCDFQRE